MPSTESQKPSLLTRHRQLAPRASLRVSPLCLGAMTFGNAHQEKYGEITKETSFAILDHFYDNGGNFIDTANAYKDGESEMWVGEWMAQRENRDEIVLATKYSSPYTPNAKLRSNIGGNNAKSLRNSIASSLKRLQTTYIDLFYVHFWDYTTPIPELMQSLNDLVSNGTVLYLGISDTPAWIVATANQYARDHGLRQFAVYQGMWNAAMRDFERDIIPMCGAEGMAMCPYGTLNQGRFQTEEVFKAREKKQEGRNFIPLSQRDKDVSRVLESIANDRNSNSNSSDEVQLHHLALAYVFNKAPYVFPLVGARKVEHIEGTILALGVQLTPREIELIEDAYPFDHGFPHTFLSGTMFDPKQKPRGVSHPAGVGMNAPYGPIDWVDDPSPIIPAQK